MKEKVILAYSGGLDTTAIIPWLKENFDYEVICVLHRLRTGRRAGRSGRKSNLLRCFQIIYPRCK